MIPREIVAQTLRCQEPDASPYWLMIDPDVVCRVDEHYGSDKWRSKIVPFIYGRHVCFKIDQLPDGTFRDEFGTVLGLGNILHVEQPALSSPTLNGYHWPDPEEIDDWDALGKEFGSVDQSYRLCGMAFGLFERSWLMRGFENILMDLMDHPGFVEELLDGITETHLKVMDIIAKRIPAEAYFGGDDICDQRGPIMGIELWRKFFKPCLARVIRHCHELGRPYVMHSCGNVLPLVDDFLEIGMDGLESLQPEAMDIYELKRRTAGKMFLIGGMGTQSTLPFGTPDDVHKETCRLISEMGRGGGYVLAASKPIMRDVPTENVVAFVETATGTALL